MTGKLLGVGIAVIIVAALGVILAAQKKPETVTPGISDTWIHLNENVAIALKPCPDPKQAGDPYAKVRGDLCGTLMIRTAPGNDWRRVLLDSPPPIVGLHPITK
jgi:hypothetical protein